MCGGRIYTNHIKWKEVKKDMIYLDNSATTQVDKDVAMTACEVMFTETHHPRICLEGMRWGG